MVSYAPLWEYDYINGEKKCYGMYAENVEDYYPYAVIRTTDTKEIENEDGTKEIKLSQRITPYRVLR